MDPRKSVVANVSIGFLTNVMDSPNPYMVSQTGEHFQERIIDVLYSMYLQSIT